MPGTRERMAIRIDRPRFRSIFGRLGMPRDESEDFVDALEDTFAENRQDVAEKQDLSSLAADLKRDAAEREARMMQNLLVFVGFILTAIALATGIIIAVVTLT